MLNVYHDFLGEGKMNSMTGHEIIDWYNFIIQHQFPGSIILGGLS